MSEARFVPVARVEDLPPGTLKVVEVGGRSILLCHSEGMYAVENRCSHAEQPLAGGTIRWGWLACPTHGAKFDLATGEPLSGPATEPIATFPLRVVGEVIEIAV